MLAERRTATSFATITAVAAIVAVAGLTTTDVLASTTPPQPAASAVAPSGITIGLEYPRYLQAKRTPTGGEIEVTVTNDSSATLELVDLTVDTALFGPAGADVVPTADPNARKLVPPGRRFDYPVPIGAAICDADGPTDVVATLLHGDAPAQTGRFVVDDEPLRQLHDRECAARAVLDAVDISIGEPFTVDDEGLVSATLTVSRRAGSDLVTITGARGSALIAVRAESAETDEAAPVLTLAPDSSAAQAALTIEVVRCDSHAVSESKKTFRWNVWVVLGDGDEVFLEVVPDEALQRAVTAAIDDCLRAESAAMQPTPSAA